MTKTILITGSTDGIGFAAAQTLAEGGHRVLLHGRSAEKLAQKSAAIKAGSPAGTVETFLCDLTRMSEVKQLAAEVSAAHPPQGHDVRFLVNTFAPYLLAQKLLPIIPKSGRIINLSSAAQNPINFDAMAGRVRQADMEAYAQSKLAITIWSRHMAQQIPDGPLVVSVNPASLIGTKMVKEGFGIEGKDIRIGADILVEAAIGESFEGRSGEYFDNDAGRFGPPHPHATDPQMIAKVMAAMEDILPQLP